MLVSMLYLVRQSKVLQGSRDLITQTESRQMSKACWRGHIWGDSEGKYVDAWFEVLIWGFLLSRSVPLVGIVSLI